MTPRSLNRPVQLQRISRRGLISSAVLAGVLSATGVQVQARARGGVLRLGLSAETLAQVAGAGTVYDTLTEITATGELTGELAESWEPGAGAAAWTIALRRGVPFHDGHEVTAADVAASFAGHGRGPLLRGVTGIQAVGSHQIRFALAAPDANFPLRLADPHLTVAPEGQFVGIGSGLYRLAEDGGDRLRLARVEAHYRDGRAGWFDAVVLRLMPDPAARAAALAGGHVDAVDFPADAAAIAARRNLRLVTTEGHGLALTGGQVASARAAGLPVADGAPDAPAVARAPGEGAIYGAGFDSLFAAPAATGIAGHMPFALAHADRLRHDGIGTLAPMDSARIAERWWFA